jgi:outer membrane receptor protein involved in Fe transport
MSVAVASIALALVSAAAQDTGRREAAVRRADSSAVVLEPLEVRASIVPTAGTLIRSGIPARITVLSRRELDAWRPRSLADALGSRAGVSLYDDLGSFSKPNLTTRGFSAGPTVGVPAGVSVFLDGVRQNEPDAQEVNFDLLPLDHVRRIELLSGTASLLGPNSLGGAINLVTDYGAGPPSGEVEVSAGSFDAYSAAGRASGRSRTGWDYYLSGGHEREDGWRRETGATRSNLFLNLGQRGPERGVALQAYGVRSRAETAGSLPESLFDPTPDANFTAGDFEQLDAEQLSLSGYAPMGRGHGGLTTYVRRSHATRFNVNQAPDPDVRSITTNSRLGATADWRRSVGLGGGTLALRFGVDAGANRVRIRIFNEAPGAGSSQPMQTLTTDARSPSWDAAGYTIADWRLGRVTFSAGTRYDLVRVPFENQLEPDDRTNNRFDHLSPRGGLSLDLGAGATAYASIGQSFRAPAILELACADPDASCPLPFALGEDPPLRPVQATTYELGGHWGSGGVVLSASAYWTELRNEIFFVASDRALLSGFFTNLGRTRREGVELEAESALARDRIHLYANYAWTRATFRTPASLFSIRSDEDFAGSPLAGPNDARPGDALSLVPEHQAKAGALVVLPGRLTAGVDARYVGRQWLRGDEANATTPLAPYFLANVRLGYTLGRWDVSGIVTNLFGTHRASFGTFNENRQTGELERFLTPLDARMVRVFVRLGFGRGAAQDQ